MDVLRQHIDVPPPAPSQLRDDVAADLDEIVLRCLAKDPADRPSTANELGELLRRCADAGH